jgi:hypothetical protein
MLNGRKTTRRMPSPSERSIHDGFRFRKAVLGALSHNAAGDAL